MRTISDLYERLGSDTENKKTSEDLINGITRTVTRESIPYFGEGERADLYFWTIDILKSYGLNNQHIRQARQAVCDNNDLKGKDKNKDGKIQKNKDHHKPDFSKILNEYA